MKKLIAVVMCLCLVVGIVGYADTSDEVKHKGYELWAQSPSITCGLTTEDMRIYKALDQDLLELLPLNKLGKNYYMAICSHYRTDGGDNESEETTKFYFYTLYATDTGFIILSAETAENEYYWNEGYAIADISDNMDSSYYKDSGYETPYYIMTPKGKYTHREYTEYDEYFFITDTGKMYKMLEEVDNGTEGYPFIKDGKIYRGQESYYKSSSYYDYHMADGTTLASNTKPMFFENGSISLGVATKIAVEDMTPENGYAIYRDVFSSNLSIKSYHPIPGSDNLFFTKSATKYYDSTDKKNYFTLNLSLYKSDNGVMTEVKSAKLSTKSTSSTFTPQKIEGIDETYYISKGLSIPSVTFGHYAVIGRDGTICGLNLDNSIYSQYCYPCTFNGHYAINRSYTGTKYVYKKDPADGEYYYWQMINEISFDSNGELTISEDKELKIQSEAHSGQNGFFSKYSTWNSPNFETISGKSVKAWWGRTLDNIFPDGRYVNTSWNGLGNGIFELWYDVYDSDKTIIASGPTGYSDYFGTVFKTPDLIAWTVNDTKFVVCHNELNNTFFKEYYRVAVNEETVAGEIVGKLELGKKSIAPPESSDTEVVENVIDFGSAELPLGFDIKDNVIDSGKLDVFLREQVNSVRLNDIVILAKEGYQSGEQNTGVTLSSYSEYDNTLGSSDVRLYTNGQYFRWYCNNPEELTPGTYHKSIEIGDKTVYVTFKVVKPPTNEGSTMVVF